MRNLSFWCVSSLFLCGFFPVQAQEALLDLNLDRKTKQFLQSTSTESPQLLLLYRSTHSPAANLSLAQRIQQTKIQESKVFGVSSLSHPQRETLWLLHGTIAKLNKEQLEIILQSDSQKEIHSIITLSRWAQIPAGPAYEPFERNKAFTWGLDLIGLPLLKQTLPLLAGKGVRLGVIDTGIDPKHRDLKGRTLHFRNFLDPAASLPFDDNGHGTHVAGTMVGGSSSSITIGLAPQADLVVAKAFSARGWAQDAHLLLALQWMADPDGDPLTADGVRVINNSWNFSDSYSGKNPEDEPFCLAIEKLEQLGILSVFSSGNSGPDRGSVQIPGSCPHALTVGASDENDTVASFSSRGPVQWRNIQLAKPEIVAPGVKVLSAYPDMFATRSGTSMAAPHVTGALALLAQMHPSLSSIDLKALLLKHPKDIGPPGFDSDTGQGRLDLIPFLKQSR